MKALTQLPAATKDRLLPLIIGRPWPNAKHLVRTWEKIGEAIGNRRFALDLDRTKRNSGGGKPAASEFDALFEAHNGFENYYDAIAGNRRSFAGLEDKRWIGDPIRSAG